MNILVLNAGSSSLKYALIDVKAGKRILDGAAERIGPGSPPPNPGPSCHCSAFPSHVAALEWLLGSESGLGLPGRDPEAVAHRVVHGGPGITETSFCTDEVLAAIREHANLAPLHNPAALGGILAVRDLLPSVPQVAVFDTSFGSGLPAHAAEYALPRPWVQRFGFRRLGFHGLSHRDVAKAAARRHPEKASHLRLVSCHLGSGASIAAVAGGRCMDTSMGFTPLEGLCMGTRAGDVDPGIILRLLEAGMTREEITRGLTKEAGLLGLSEIAGDLRAVEAASTGGHPGAALALDVFIYRVVKYIGAYTAALGGLDVLAFTGGIGENSPLVRSRVAGSLGFLGVTLDPAANRRVLRRKGMAPTRSGVTRISVPGAAIEVIVVQADEEMVAAEEAAGLLAGRRPVGMEHGW